MMFSAGLLISAGATIALAVTDKILEESGIHWLGTAVRIIVPLIGMGLAVYFLDHNALLRWIK